jgi:hypothetical protein
VWPLVLIGVGSACITDTRLRDLETVGIVTRVDTLGWYRFERAGAYRFRMPGVPVAERESYFFGGVSVPALYFDLSAEANSRGYLLRVFDAVELDPPAREALREEAEAMMLRAAEDASAPETVPYAGGMAHERLLRDLTSNGHHGILRTVVLDRFVFQLVVIMAPGSGDASDARAFFDSIGVVAGP